MAVEGRWRTLVELRDAIKKHFESLWPREMGFAVSADPLGLYPLLTDECETAFLKLDPIVL
jgi:hypothetical protein